MFASRLELTKGPRNVSSIIMPSRTQSSFIFMKNCTDQSHFINLNSTDFENEHRNLIFKLNEGLESPQWNYTGPHISRGFCTTLLCLQTLHLPSTGCLTIQKMEVHPSIGWQPIDGWWLQLIC